MSIMSCFAEKFPDLPSLWQSPTPEELFFGQQHKVNLINNLETALSYCDIGKNIISADVNAAFTVLSVSKKGGLVQFFSLADLQNVFLFKEFKILNEGEIDQVAFSKNSDELACLSRFNKKIFYILTKEKEGFEVMGFVKLPYTPESMCWNKSSKSVIKPKF